MKLSTKIAYNTIIQFASKIVSTGLGLIAIAITARALGVTGFGEYTVAITFISFFAISADLGLTLITVQMISQPKADENKILGNLMGLRLISAAILIGLGPLVATFFPYSHEVKIAITAVSLSFFFIALNQIFVGIFQKYLRMDKVSLAEVISRGLMVALVFLSIKQDFGLLGIMFAISISSALNFFLLLFYSKKFTQFKVLFDFVYWKKIIALSWPLALTIIFNLLYLKTDTFLLSIIKRPSEIGIIAEVGLYGAAYKVIDVLITFPFMFAGIILPILTHHWASRTHDNFFAILQKAFDVMAIFSFPLIAGTFFVAEDIVRIVAGDEFVNAAPILRILIIAAAIIFPGTLFSHAIIAINKQRKIISSYLFVAISSVILYLIFIPQFSYLAAAWITIYSEVAIALLMMMLVYHYTRFLPNFTIMIKSTIATFFMSAIIMTLYRFEIDNLIIILTVGVTSYLIFLYLFKGIKQEDIKTLLNKN